MINVRYINCVWCFEIHIRDCTVLMHFFANLYPKAYEEESPIKSKAQKLIRKKVQQKARSKGPPRRLKNKKCPKRGRQPISTNKEEIILILKIKKLSVCLAKVIFINLFYYSAYFLYIDPTAFFGTIHRSTCTISTNFYFYLQYFQQKVFSFNKIIISQTKSKREKPFHFNSNQTHDKNPL